MDFVVFLTALLLATGVVMGSPIDLANTTMIDFDSQPANLIKRSHNGFATAYYQEGGTGSCGHKHRDSDHVVSIAPYWYTKYGKNFLCGRGVGVKNTGHYLDNSIGGKGNVIYPKIVDTCSACTSDTAHVDLSIRSWDKLTNNAGLSNVKVHWYFCGIGGEC